MPRIVLDRDTLSAALVGSAWDIKATAARLGVSRQAIYDAIRRWELRPTKRVEAAREARLREVAATSSRRALAVRWGRPRGEAA